MRVLGVDPGLDGGLAFVSSPEEVTIYPMPTLQVGRGASKTVREIDLTGLNALLNVEAFDVAYVEAVGASPQMGVSSAFAFGKGFGALLGMLAARRARVEFAQPTVWKRAMGIRTGASKDASRQRAGQVFPLHAESFLLVKSDGLAEASLIAAYGLRLEAGR
jgi:crossover junction endodeoxyribonuclease RuvC